MSLLRNTTKILPLKSIGVFALSLGLMASAKAQDGEKLFKEKTCAGCHKVEGRSVGPGLKGATTRKDLSWITKFVKDPNAVYQSGDPYLKGLVNDFGMVMPAQNVSDEEIKAIFAYIDAQGGAAAPAATGEAKAAEPVKPITAADIVKGKSLFEGTLALKNGGPSCISCHHVKYPDLMQGGLLAKDLTEVYTRLGSGVGGFISSGGSGAMKAAFENNPITQEEADALAAFFQDAVKSSHFLQKDKSDHLLTGGFIAFVIFLTAIALIWFRRKKHSVKKNYHERQTEAIN